MKNELLHYLPPYAKRRGSYDYIHIEGDGSWIDRIDRMDGEARYQRASQATGELHCFRTRCPRCGGYDYVTIMPTTGTPKGSNGYNEYIALYTDFSNAWLNPLFIEYEPRCTCIPF